MMKRKKRKRRFGSRSRLQVHEVNHIVQNAQMGVSQIVALGALIFFSTETGDAWMLDVSDGLALQLAQGGDELSYIVKKSGKGFEVAWTSSYHIEQETFVVFNHTTGRIRTIYGYPTTEIIELIKREDTSSDLS